MANIVVDLTPLLPGGENGGAKPMVLALLKYLPDLLPNSRFVLLTYSASHDELALLDRENVVRLCARHEAPPRTDRLANMLQQARVLRQRVMKKLLSPEIYTSLKGVYRRIRKPGNPGISKSFLEQLDADLLFCPFTAPIFHEKSVPTVSIVYDLQFLKYPQFFHSDDLFFRQSNFQETVDAASHIITISNFVRDTVLENSTFDPGAVTTVHIGHVHTFQIPLESEKLRILSELGLEAGRFLFYPANFWAHKNHATLLTAFRIYLERNPGSDVKLVCTGALDARRDELIRASQQMGLAGRVVFPGFLPVPELSVLYHSALALVFPSLYEGFGIPLIEAFSMRIPVLCSDATSLPEVGGDAPFYFNPHSPKTIADGIEKVVNDPALRQEMIRKGTERLRLFDSAQRMAVQYAEVLKKFLVKA